MVWMTALAVIFGVTLVLRLDEILPLTDLQQRKENPWMKLLQCVLQQRHNNDFCKKHINIHVRSATEFNLYKVTAIALSKTCLLVS